MNRNKIEKINDSFPCTYDHSDFSIHRSNLIQMCYIENEFYVFASVVERKKMTD